MLQKKISYFLFATLLFIFQNNILFANEHSANINSYVSLIALFSMIGIIFAIVLAISVLKNKEGNSRMVEIGEAIRNGANAFLNKQYRWLLVFAIIVATILSSIYYFDTTSVQEIWYIIPVSFLIGSFISGISGFIGMKIATRANNRTTWAAKSSLNRGLRIAFSSGTVMGMTVVSFGLLSLTAMYYFSFVVLQASAEQMSAILFSFAMGASSIALFARIGGGIYTKAADVGADLVGKVEAGIPEDDPRNPATIADSVGDNVGDVAGMGADLFESYVGSIIATIVLAVPAFSGNMQYSFTAAMAPLMLSGFGILASILGNFFVKTKEGADQESLLWSLRKGVYSASIFIILFAFILIHFILQLPIGIFFAIIVGLAAGNIIGYFTEYYTSDNYKPTKKVAESSQTGHATIIISGLALGMRSTVIPVITVVIATIIAYISAGGTENMPMGLYGIGMATVGMLSTLGITLSTDAYGPIADNAGGIAEMAQLEPEVRERTDALDTLGNTTAATGKGFAIGSAALTSLTLLAALYSALGNYINDFSLINPNTLSGLFIGAMIPFFFSSLTMSAVGNAAMSMVEEVRRQFREIDGIMEGKVKPDYSRCVSISTAGALKQMVSPTLLAIFTPIIVGILLGPTAIISLVSGCLVSGFSMAVMMANSGGSWDNAKKYIEKGNLGGKGSDNHKAAVTGDTVGDPFKDTSGPSINILIKLISVVSLVFGPFLSKINKILFF